VIVLLDSGPLGMICHPQTTPANQGCKGWFVGLVGAGVSLGIPAIVDYEIRRELLRAGKGPSVQHLDELGIEHGVIPLSGDVLKLAAGLWAWARTQKIQMQTAPDAALDIDILLAATAIDLERQEGESVIIATGNVGHLSRFAKADLWSNIQPVV
jgi:hypothetical protein